MSGQSTSRSRGQTGFNPGGCSQSRFPTGAACSETDPVGPENADADVLVLGYGNPGRLDDGLGMAVVNAISGRPGVHAEHDYQLNIEHADLIAGFATVVFADATTIGEEPFFFRRLLPRRAGSFSSHVVRPESVLAMAAEVFGWKGRAFLLGVRGWEFNEYNEQLSSRAQENLAAAVEMLARALAAEDMETMTTAGPLDDSAAACNGGDTCETANM